MSGERVFSVAGSTATPAVPISLAEAGLKERADLQEWVLAHPEIMGPDVMVIGLEFDRWQAASGQRPLDRLDVLGLDSGGRLVVAELKRDRAPDTVEMQALKYAAMCSRFAEEDVVAVHRAFRARSGDGDEESARAAIAAHAGDLDPELLRRPRIVLVAGAFPPVVTATAVWLTEMGLDLVLQRVQAYRLHGAGEIVISVSQLFPIPDIEEFTVSPHRADVQASVERRSRAREGSTVVRLTASEAIADGTALRLVPTGEVTAEVADALLAWVEEEPARGRAVWRNDRSAPLEWEADGARYRPTPLVSRMLEEVGGIARRVRGPHWWRLEDGRDLTEVAAGLPSVRFDWAPLHEVLLAIPPGSWTTYGELAAAVGTAPQPLGQHLNNCGECENAHRVLGHDGRPVSGFAWSDPAQTRSQREVLEDEGLTFDGDRADEARRLSAADLLASTDSWAAD